MYLWLPFLVSIRWRGRKKRLLKILIFVLFVSNIERGLERHQNVNSKELCLSLVNWVCKLLSFVTLLTWNWLCLSVDEKTDVNHCRFWAERSNNVFCTRDSGQFLCFCITITGLYCVATRIFPNSEYTFTFLFCVACFVSYTWSKFACKTQSKSFIEHAFEPDVHANNLVHLRAPDHRLSGILNLKYRSVIGNKWFHR